MTELLQLKDSPVEVSVDTLDLLEATRSQHARTSNFASLEEMMVLLRLMAAEFDQEASASAPGSGLSNRL